MSSAPSATRFEPAVPRNRLLHAEGLPADFQREECAPAAFVLWEPGSTIQRQPSKNVARLSRNREPFLLVINLAGCQRLMMCARSTRWQGGVP